VEEGGERQANRNAKAIHASLVTCSVRYHLKRRLACQHQTSPRYALVAFISRAGLNRDRELTPTILEIACSFLPKEEA